MHKEKLMDEVTTPKHREKESGMVVERVALVIDKSAGRDCNIMVMYRRATNDPSIFYVMDSMEFMARFEPVGDLNG